MPLPFEYPRNSQKEKKSCNKPCIESTSSGLCCGSPRHADQASVLVIHFTTTGRGSCWRRRRRQRRQRRQRRSSHSQLRARLRKQELWLR